MPVRGAEVRPRAFDYLRGHGVAVIVVSPPTGYAPYVAGVPPSEDVPSSPACGAACVPATTITASATTRPSAFERPATRTE